mgnify:CR=1 FL=1
MSRCSSKLRHYMGGNSIRPTIKEGISTTNEGINMSVMKVSAVNDAMAG